LLERQKIFLVRTEQPFDAFADMRQLPLQALFAFFRWIRRACRRQAAVEFLLDQRWVFEQSDNLGPDDLVEQVLSYETTVVAHRTTEFSPAVRTNAFVVMDLTRTRVRRCARERIATLLAADQTLDHARRDGPAF